MHNIVYNASPSYHAENDSKSKLVQQKYIYSIPVQASLCADWQTRNQFLLSPSSTLLLIGNNSPGHCAFQDICTCTCKILYNSEIWHRSNGLESFWRTWNDLNYTRGNS